MRIVVDVNVIISSLLSKGDSFNIFAANSIFNKFEFVAPEFLMIELEKHKKEILTRSKLSEEKFEEILAFITEQISIIPSSQFDDSLPKANELLKDHLKDIQYVALSLKLNCSILSGDKTLKKLCPEIVLNPKELLNQMYR